MMKKSKKPVSKTFRVVQQFGFDDRLDLVPEELCQAYDRGKLQLVPMAGVACRSDGIRGLKGKLFTLLPLKVKTEMCPLN